MGNTVKRGGGSAREILAMQLSYMKGPERAKAESPVLGIKGRGQGTLRERLFK